MKIGDKVRFTFGNTLDEKEGIIIKLYPKNVHISVDFPDHKGRIVHRKRHQLT